MSLKSKILEEINFSKEEEYNKANFELRKKLLGSKYKQQANRKYDALSDSAKGFIIGKKFKDVWKNKKQQYQSYGDKKDN